MAKIGGNMSDASTPSRSISARRLCGVVGRPGSPTPPLSRASGVSLGPGKPPLATIITPGFAIAYPEFTLFTPVFDVWRTMPQRLGQAFGPQVLGQIPQVNVIVG